ncbi:50S ribosomal protein L21 [Deltaproteobacteria bacterium TL4]
MYAIIRSGGKQYQVTPGTTVKLDRFQAEPGEAFETDQVILFKNEDQLRIGAPLVEGASVKGTVVVHGKDKKVIVFKRKRRRGYRNKNGHRQQFTTVKIEAITA